jgi:hypothetical protein
MSDLEQLYDRAVDLEEDFAALLELLGIEIHEFKFQRTGVRNNPWIKKKVAVFTQKNGK